MTALPPRWEEVSLGEICERVEKWDPHKSPATEFEYVDIGAIDDQRVTKSTTLLGSEAPSRARQLVKRGDTILSTVRTYLVNTALVPDELDGATVSTGFCVLRPTTAVDSKFLFHRVIESDFVARLSEAQAGSSYPAVRDTDVFARRIALPPLAEQRRIVAALEKQLSRLDAAEAELRQAASRLVLLERAAVERAFSADWPRQPLGAIAELVGGVTKNTAGEADPANVAVPYLRVANVQRGYLDLSNVTTIRVRPETAAKLALRDGDVLFNEGGDRDKLGRGWVWSGEIDGCIHQNHVFRARLSEPFEPKFVSWWGNSFGRVWFWEHGRQTTNLASISLSTLKAFPVPSPPLAEQRQAVEKIDRILVAAAHMREQIDKARLRSSTLRRSILASAFRGELVPQDPDDEPSSVLLERIVAERAAAPKPARNRREKASA